MACVDIDVACETCGVMVSIGTSPKVRLGNESTGSGLRIKRVVWVLLGLFPIFLDTMQWELPLDNLACKVDCCIISPCRCQNVCCNELISGIFSLEAGYQLKAV